jgi:hypothetical protein
MLSENNDPSRDDSWLADETAAAMREFAGTVTEAPPLRLAAGFSSAGARRSLLGTRRWWTWLAPVTAATAVTALAVGLVLIRSMPNGGVVPAAVGVVPTADSTPATASGAGPHGVPRYYLAIQQNFSKPTAGQPPVLTTHLVVGDSLTAKPVATFAPPAGVRFLDVTAAGDDRTFVAAGQVGSGASATIRLFEVRVEPGSSHPAQLTAMPVAPLLVGDGKSVDLVTDSFPVALSGSGTELAVAEFSKTGAMAVKVFSVATGSLLDQWTTTDPSLSLRGLSEAPTLSWIDGGRALALATLGAATKSGTDDYTAWQTVRSLNVDGTMTGDLIADGSVLRDVQVGGAFGDSDACGYMLQWPPAVSADGKTFSCTTGAAFVTYPLAPGAVGTGPGKVDLRVGNNEFVINVLWANTTGDTLIATWGVQDSNTVASNPNTKDVQIDVISHGKATPLRFPQGFQPVFPGGVAW